MSGRILALVFFGACSLPATAAADWIVSPYIGTRFAANTTFVVGREGTEESKFLFGSSIGLLTDGVLGVEADLAFVPGFFDGSSIVQSRVTTLMGNVVLATPLGVNQYGLRPYLTGGLGLLRARGNDTFGPVISSNLLGMNIGGGAIGPISERTSLRFDLRYIRNLGTDDETPLASNAGFQLKFWRGTVGLTFRF